jgi:CPA1 family monovalent cation:H+ antiporter
MIPETALLLLFVAASLLAVIANRLRLPYTVALVLGGLLLGSLHLFQTPVLTHNLVFNIFLPGLIFESAYHLSASTLWRDRIAIFGLAVPGVFLSMIVTAYVFLALYPYLPHLAGITLTLGVALVFGATVAATDPISVVSIFRQLGAPSRLTFLIESESLLNDGTAIVFFTLFLGIAMGKAISLPALGLEFVSMVGGGALLGLIIGWLSSEVIKRVNDGMVEITITILAAYSSFLLATQLNFSGVIATVVAGLLCGNYAARRGMSASVRMAVNTFWEYLGFVLNSLIFLLVGLTIHLQDLIRIWVLILAAYLAVTVARAVVVYGMGLLLRTTRARIPLNWNFILLWGGIRGALSMVLALSLPMDFPARDLLINLVFGVVLLTILVQGLSIAPLGRLFGVLAGKNDDGNFERNRLRLALAEHDLRELQSLESRALRDPQVLQLLQKQITEERDRAEEHLAAGNFDQDWIRQSDYLRLVRRLLVQRKQRILDARQEGLLDESGAEELLADLDTQLLELESAPAQVFQRANELHSGPGTDQRNADV